MESSPKRTPLYATHVALGARMVAFAGWLMPVEYDGIIEEHHRTRKAATIFDTCHMGIFELQGSTAETDLERLLTMRISTLQIGQGRYGYMLREDGGVLDDLTCFRLGPDHFMLVVNAGTTDQDREWILNHLSSHTVFRDRCSELGKLDVQGPTSQSVLEAAFTISVPTLKYFWMSDCRLGDTPVRLSRSGYTGEWGYELYAPRDAVASLWAQLLERGGVRPAGLGARDTLRLEAGYPLYGHELSVEHTPVPVSRGQFIDATKNFIGREAVLRDLQRGCSHYLAGLRLTTRQAARAGDEVFWYGESVGRVTSGAFAPSLGVAVAMAYLRADLCTPGNQVDIRVRGKALSGQVCPLPFYREGTARRRMSGSDSSAQRNSG